MFKRRQKIYEMDPAALTADGFIVHQGRLKKISYGHFYSSYNGCGWIASYNFLHAVNGTEDWQAVCREMERYLLLWGVLGTNFFGLWWYLHRKGYRFRFSLTLRGAERNLARAQADYRKGKIPAACGINLYFHRKGAHFITFLGNHGPVVRFLNLRYGAANDYRTLRQFYKAHVKFPITLTLILKNKV